MALEDELCSSNGLFVLKIIDRNLIIYEKLNGRERKKIWSTEKINSRAPARTCLTSDGNLIIYNWSNFKIWTSRSSNANGADVHAVLENNGSFVIFGGDEKMWSTSGLSLEAI